MNISYSAMKAFERCGWQQKLLHVDKVGPEKEDKRRYIAGSTGHEFFTEFYKSGFHKEFPTLRALEIFDELEKKEFVVWKNKEDRDKVRLKTVEDAEKIKEAVFMTGLDKFRATMYNERWLSAIAPKMYPHMLRGKSDIVIFSEDWILDTKVTASSQYLDVDQLIFYAILYLLCVKRKVKRISFFAPLMSDHRKIMDANIDEIDYYSMLERIEAYVDAWQHKDFLVTGDESKDCYFCQVKAHCPRYSMTNYKTVGNIKRVSFSK